MTKAIKQKIAVVDLETDPFKFGRKPEPFCFGFYDGERYIDYWGDDCIKVFTDMMEDFEEPMMVFAHNGGKFDFLYFIDKFCGDIRIVNGRILEGKIGKHVFRDSYGILPIPLKDSGGKKEIDYKFMERKWREIHKQEILEYLKADCVALYDLVIAFVEEFGDVLTIGSASMKQFKKFHKFETGNKSYDSFFRQYYFGGRCQCFEVGVFDGKFEYVDLNSAYPATMKDCEHPVSVRHEITTGITDRTSFVCWEGRNFNAVPIRDKFGLDFTKESGTFWTTIHEFNAGLDTGTIEPKRIKHAIEFEKTMKFGDFVNYFYESRQIAKKHGDKFHDIFYKLILNSSYGKFAQNPEHYCDSIILPWGEVGPEGYFIEFRHDNYAIWSKPTEKHAYYNVATAASITGATRALLLRGISNATRPLYTDTDAIICEKFSGDIDDKRLGAWKTEATGTQIAIAGKKLYAFMDGDVCKKKASKGVNLPPLAIFSIARGDTVETVKDAPTFKLDGGHSFITRNVKRTGKLAA